MKERAITYLMKNPLLHMDMIEVIRRNTADILYAEIDGVLLKEEKSKAYMISVDNFKRGKELINSILKCDLIVSHQEFMVDYISNKFQLSKKLECFQAVCTNKVKVDRKEELEIEELDQNKIEIILKHYDKLSKMEIKEILKNGNLYGGYKNDTLVGFAGNHLEGSIGILEVFPQYRRLGYGAMLESYMVDKMLERDLLPFGQIEVNNENSLSLQRKLGFSISKDRLYWMF